MARGKMHKNLVKFGPAVFEYRQKYSSQHFEALLTGTKITQLIVSAK